ncbi:MAG: protein kinase [Gemmataceae bacterium]
MRQTQVCTHGHRWDPMSDRRADEHARWTVCPVCGSSVEMFSLHDTGDGNGELPRPHHREVAPVAPPADPGIPGYEVLHTVGYGGVGVVYRARQSATGRIVALKMLTAGIRAQPRELARFQNEAQAAALLDHPHLVRVLEVGSHGGLPYVVMEFMERGTLLEAIAGNPLPPRHAADLLEMLARGMQTAHDKGIVHRDLKPGNVLLSGSVDELPVDHPARATMLLLGVPKVSDFGLAKQMNEEGAQTRTGTILGTPYYMAPEQAQGKGREVGPTADIYSLGAILYECLTGRPPFRGSSTLEVLDQVRTQEVVRPSLLRPEIPRDLETICLKCLEKDPARRYARAIDLADDLRRYLDGQSIVARPTPGWRRPVRWAQRHVMILIVALLAATTLGLVVSLAMQLGRKPPVTPEPVEVAYFTNFVKVRGAPRGIGPLTEAKARRRGVSFRFELRGGQVQKIESVDHHGLLSTQHAVIPHLSDIEPGLRATFVMPGRPVVPSVVRPSFTPGFITGGARLGNTMCSWEYERDESGRVTREIARDAAGRIVWIFLLNRDGIAHYTDERGFMLTRAGSGASYVQITWNDEGLETEVRYLGRNGKPRPGRDGIFGRRYKHDSNGLVTAVTFLGPRDQPAVNRLGYGRVVRKWSPDGLLLEESYLDLRGKPVRGLITAAMLRVSYNADGNPVLRESLGLDGKPTVGSYRMAYDDRGRMRSYESLQGLASSRLRQTYEYDDADNCSRVYHENPEAGFDPEGNPVSGRSYRTALSYDSQRRVRELIYLDDEGKPAARVEKGPLAGVVRATFEYNPRGQVLSEAYFDLNGKPAAIGGIARVVRQYDEAGHLTDLAFYDRDDRLTAGTGTNSRVARKTWKYDEQGRLEEFTNHGIDGELTTEPERMERGTTESSLTNMLTMAALWQLPLPFAAATVSHGRCAIQYDERGNVESLIVYGSDGQPLEDSVGVARVEARYDELGNLSELASLDGEARPKPAGSVARRTWRHDASGNITEMATYGPSGQLVASVYGVARHTRRFDNAFNLVEETFYGADNKPTLGTLGYCKARYAYDAAGDLNSSSYFDTEGNQVSTRVVWLVNSDRTFDVVPPQAERLGGTLQAGDVILSYDGAELRCARLFAERKRKEEQTGELKQVQVLRDGKRLSLRMPAGALRGDDFFTGRGGGGPTRFAVVGVPGGLDPGLRYIGTRGQTEE